MSAELTLDVAALEKLMRLGGKEFVTQMTDLFMSYVPQKLAEARSASQAGDLAGVQKAVHPIKSSAGNIGAQPLRELATQIEHLAIDQCREPIGAKLTELETAYLQVQALLQERRKELGI